MSGVETIEREFAQYFAESDYEVPDYEVRFEYAACHDFFSALVFYRGDLIARKSLFRSYGRAAKWTLRQVRSHQKAVRRLAGLVHP